MAKGGKGSKSKSASAQKVSGGKAGQMKKFGAVQAQKPGVTQTTTKGGSRGR